MNRVVILIVVILVAIVSGVLLFNFINSEDSKEETTISLSPESTPAPTKGAKRPVRNFTVNTPLSRDTPKEEETPTPTSTPEVDLNDPYQVLYAKTNQWVYRGFVQIGDDKYGLMENFRTGDEWQVQEKEAYNEVVIDNLAFEACVLRLDTATRELTLSPKIEMDFNEIFSGPPTEEIIEDRVRHYNEHIRPTFEAMAAKYTPGPHVTMPVPLSEEEQQKNVDHYMQHIAPTFQWRARNYTPHPGEIMPQKPQSKTDEERLQKAYIATYHPEHLATAFPDWQRYFEQEEEYKRQVQERQADQGQPQPSPNQNPGY